MKGQTIALIIAGALVVFFLTSATPGIDLSSLNSQYGTDVVARLQNVANVLSANGVSGDTLKYLLSQILQETGLFTSNPNYHATDDLNNYAGISPGGTLAAYANIQAFVTDYLRVLNQGPAYPIQASGIDDFNTRLKSNGYYTDSSVTYGNNLDAYFNILS